MLYAMGASPASRGIVLAEHDPGWAELFATEAKSLRCALGPVVLEVHHVGSTAVPGLLAKPIIDVLLVATSLDDLDAYRPVLERAGYRWRAEHGIPERRYLDRLDAASSMKAAHVHAYSLGHPEIGRHLAFRNALLRSPDLRDAYAALKRALRDRDPSDRAGYQGGKATFIESVLQAAAG